MLLSKPRYVTCFSGWKEVYKTKMHNILKVVPKILTSCSVYFLQERREAQKVQNGGGINLFGEEGK